MKRLDGFPTSYWRTSIEPSTYPQLDDNLTSDVVVIGAGIAGLVTAVQLIEQGYDVTLIEADRIASGTTGYTTAKVSSQHGLIYDELIQTFGEEKANLYHEANEEAIRFLRDQTTRLAIECELEEQDAYLYVASSGPKHKQLAKEADAYSRLGINGGDATDEVKASYRIRSNKHSSSVSKPSSIRSNTYLVSPVISRNKAENFTNRRGRRLSNQNGRRPCCLNRVIRLKRKRSSSRHTFRSTTLRDSTSRNSKCTGRISYPDWSRRISRTVCS